MNVSLWRNVTLDMFPETAPSVTYILQCADGHRYDGQTNDLVRRVTDHQRGRVTATRHRRPITLVYVEAHGTRAEAFQREQQFKNGRTRSATIEHLIRKFGQETCQGFNSARSVTEPRRVT